MFLPLVICLFAALEIHEATGQSAGGLQFINSNVHGISGTVTLSNASTIVINDFNYDGLGVEVFLYSYAPGVSATRGNPGTIIRLPSSAGDSQGRFRLSRYTDVDFTVTLPEGMDVCDIGTLTVWCQPFDIVFGFVEFPRNTFVNDGADPCTVIGGGGSVTTAPPEFDNCIPLHETLQLSWRVDTDNSQVRFRLCGCQALEPGTNQYMGFGLSGSTSSTLMFGADPTIAWVDETDGPQAVDYYLSTYTQCRAGVGACPDMMDSSGMCTNDVTNVTGFVRDGQQCVAFTRPFSTNDTTCDITMDPTNQNQYIVWAVGGLGVTAFKHFIRAGPGDSPIHLGRTPQDQCSGSQLVCRGCQPFVNERIIARDDATFHAQIGPSGNERGYMGITGQAGWGIAWYINGTLIPELIVERNKTYTFIVEGGTDPNNLAVYHPFYITDSIGGGRLQNTQQEQENETIYAGFDENGNATGVGRLCELMETAASERSRQSCSEIRLYVTTLVPSASCNSRQPGTFVWTPDESTPDIVYYQCATHLNLGWRILVLNEGDPIPPRSVLTTASPPTRSVPTTASSPTRSVPTTASPPTRSVPTTAGGLQFVNSNIHGISGTVTFPNARTIVINDFNYDGLGVAVFLYSYAPGVSATRGNPGTIIRLPSSAGDSQGRFRLSRYANVDFTVTLPEGMDVCDIGTLTVWCQPFDIVFGFVEFPRNTFVNDGADPCTVIGGGGPVTTAPPEFDNCIPLHETLQLSWRVDTDNSQVRFRLCGCQALEPGTNQYMGFGLSGSTSSTLMFRADPTIAWVDETDGPQAVDYYLSAYTQCRAGVGACPDTMDSSGTCTNDVTDVTGFVRDGQQCVAFTRPFSTSDTTCDRSMDPTNQNQYIVWAVGGLGVTAFKHFIRAEPGDSPIHLGRTPQDQCSGSQLVCRGCQPFVNERIIARDDATFRTQIGPSGNERGYMAITGQAGWGIAWYINGTLIPELIVERGKTYTFIVEGGTDPNNLAVYHPFYITDSIGGGRLQNTQQEQENESVYAGFDENGNAMGVGRLCELTETAASERSRQSCSEIRSYVATLLPSASCNSRQPGTLVWTPDESTPDVVYYQCATHLNLGWRILVLNEGDPIPPRSVPTTASPPTQSVPTTASPPTLAASLPTGSAPSIVASLLIVFLVAMVTLSLSVIDVV